MGRVAGKVALVTGAARGQGRSHAVRLAEEGAEIIAVDLCAPVETAPYPMATPDDLATTASLVEDHDRRVLARQVDIRDLAGLQAVVDEAVTDFGGIDIVAANAGIVNYAPAWELTEHQWQEMIAINLTGTWKTTKAVIPSMIDRGGGGSIILTSSVSGLVGYSNLAHYVSAKHGVTGLMRALAIELAPHDIRVNSVHPTSVNTDMIHNATTYDLFFPNTADPTPDQVAEAFAPMQALRIPWVEPIDVSNAVLYLASDEARHVTGTTHLVDGGGTAPFRLPHT